MSAVGFIGLGAMGLPMARNLVARGFTVRGFDVRAAAMDTLAAPGPTRQRMRRAGRTCWCLWW